MTSVSQRLIKANVDMEAFPQYTANLTASTTNLIELLQSRKLIMYPDAAMRKAASRAVLIESTRGVRLQKKNAADQIDVVVALSMAALAAVRGQDEVYYSLRDGAFSTEDDVFEDPVKAKEARDQDFRNQFASYIYQVSGGRLWPQ
jgi:phage terminase large subunit-like protein